MQSMGKSGSLDATQCRQALSRDSEKRGLGPLAFLRLLTDNSRGWAEGAPSQAVGVLASSRSPVPSPDAKGRRTRGGQGAGHADYCEMGLAVLGGRHMVSGRLPLLSAWRDRGQMRLPEDWPRRIGRPCVEIRCANRGVLPSGSWPSSRPDPCRSLPVSCGAAFRPLATVVLYNVRSISNQPIGRVHSWRCNLGWVAPTGPSSDHAGSHPDVASWPFRGRERGAVKPPWLFQR